MNYRQPRMARRVKKPPSRIRRKTSQVLDFLTEVFIALKTPIAFILATSILFAAFHSFIAPNLENPYGFLSVVPFYPGTTESEGIDFHPIIRDVYHAPLDTVQKVCAKNDDLSGMMKKSESHLKSIGDTISQSDISKREEIAGNFYAAATNALHAANLLEEIRSRTQQVILFTMSVSEEAKSSLLDIQSKGTVPGMPTGKTVKLYNIFGGKGNEEMKTRKQVLEVLTIHIRNIQTEMIAIRNINLNTMNALKQMRAEINAAIDILKDEKLWKEPPMAKYSWLEKLDPRQVRGVKEQRKFLGSVSGSVDKALKTMGLVRAELETIPQNLPRIDRSFLVESSIESFIETLEASVDAFRESMAEAERIRAEMLRKMKKRSN